METQAMIMAAGLGTRLRPWTLEHPKALVPVHGVPMLERVIGRMRSEGIGRIVVNVHHFASQVVEFIREKDFGVEILVSDESGRLLDTGGAIAKAAPLFGDASLLVHNVDILSNAPLEEILYRHETSGRDVTLVTSGRDSSRRLMFDAEGVLRGWHNLNTDEFRPAGIREGLGIQELSQEAFSGIYCLSPKAVASIVDYGKEIGDDKFPIMDYFLSFPEGVRMEKEYLDGLQLIDIGRPETLRAANEAGII